jgi:hypothetical protein
MEPIMKKILLSLLAIILIIEEWLWDILTALGHSLIQWLRLERVELWLTQTSPTMALVAFSIPILIVLPINLVAIGLLAHGLILEGIGVELLAKLLGTVLIARVFALTKPQLLTFNFLRVVYTTIMAWLQWAHQKVVETQVYRWGQHFKAETKARFATWFH